MSYSSLSDLQDAVEATLLIELTDDSGSGAIDLPKITRAISVADSIIDGYLSLSTPLATASVALTKISSDLALYELYVRRAAHLEVPEHITDIRKNAIDLLKAIRNGNADLGVGDSETPGSSATAAYDDVGSLFTSATLEEF